MYLLYTHLYLDLVNAFQKLYLCHAFVTHCHFIVWVHSVDKGDGKVARPQPVIFHMRARRELRHSAQETLRYSGSAVERAWRPIRKLALRAAW